MRSALGVDRRRLVAIAAVAPDARTSCGCARDGVRGAGVEARRPDRPARSASPRPRETGRRAPRDRTLGRPTSSAGSPNRARSRRGCRLRQDRRGRAGVLRTPRRSPSTTTRAAADERRSAACAAGGGDGPCASIAPRRGGARRRRGTSPRAEPRATAGPSAPSAASSSHVCARSSRRISGASCSGRGRGRLSCRGAGSAPGAFDRRDLRAASPTRG